MVKNKFGKIGILMGGPSSEREISLKSGKAVYDNLRDYGVDVSAIDIKVEDRQANINLLKQAKIDVAFIALHGRFGEDGTIQGILEEVGIPYTGSGISPSMLAMDKIASKNLFEQHGLSVPRHKILQNGSQAKGLVEDFSLPLVIKPVTGGSSIGLSIIDSAQNLDTAIELAFGFDNRIIVEEYVRGRELTVGVLDEEALPVIEIVPKNKFFDFQAKYQVGMTDYIVPARLSTGVARVVQEAALAAHKILGCFGCSRSDIILSDKGIAYVLEVNTIPGFTQTSLLPKAAKARGISFTQLCIRLLEMAYEKKSKKHSG